jgi:hypothetical protein
MHSGDGNTPNVSDVNSATPDSQITAGTASKAGTAPPSGTESGSRSGKPATEIGRLKFRIQESEGGIIKKISGHGQASAEDCHAQDPR